jgi:hypothetical protein
VGESVLLTHSRGRRTSSSAIGIFRLNFDRIFDHAPVKQGSQGISGEP